VKIYFLPWWMNTFWGRWLSGHWPPAIALRSALTDAYEYERAETEVGQRASHVMHSVGACIQANFDEAFKRQLIEDFDLWLKAVAERERLGMRNLSRRQ
jgi:hypothetical protein